MMAIGAASEERLVSSTICGDNKFRWALPIASATTFCLSGLIIALSIAGRLPFEIQTVDTWLHKVQRPYPTAVWSNTKALIRDYQSGKTWIYYTADKRYVYEYDCIMPGDCGINPGEQLPAISKTDPVTCRFVLPPNRIVIKL